MKTLIYIIIALGLFEIVSNLCHLLKGNKESIGLSAKKQHQELSLELGFIHFYVKAIIMFVFGFLFIASGFTALQNNSRVFFAIVLGLFALYGLVQAFYYKQPYKVWMSLVVYILPIVVFLILSGKAKEDTNEAGNYIVIEQFVFPFLLGIEPIKRVLVISFKNDPEFEMIEPQYFNDSVFGKGLRILMYRTDKKIDVYYQPGIFFDSTSFAVGKGLNHAAETQISPARFEISETGVDIDVAFTDYKGRRVELFIKENSKASNPFPFLAPVGNDVDKPSKLFLAYMQEFDFVKREGTTIRAQVGNRTLIPATFPINRDGQKVYFARYSTKITIGEINATTSAPLVFNNIQGNFETGIHHINLNQEQKVVDYWIDSGTDEIEMKFENGFPNLLTLTENEKAKGNWQYVVSGTVVTGGNYSLLRSGELVAVELDVTQKWKPGNLPLSFRVFTCFVRYFRTWPTTYRWNGSVNLKDMSMQGQWQRK